MNTYRVALDEEDSYYDFVNADYYWVDSRGYLVFYRNSEQSNAVEVAIFDSWRSAIMMDEVDGSDNGD